MSTDPLMNTDDDQQQTSGYNLKPKKGLNIQPLAKSAPPIPGASEELLKELAEKTAELTKKLPGTDEIRERILNIEDKSEEDILKELSEQKKRNSDTEKTADPSIRSKNPATELIRSKLERLYKKEPDAAEEAIESYEAGKTRSTHQQFMYDLTTSGKSLADIQTQWHNYYVNLPDNEKHQVWKEFYETQHKLSKFTQATQHYPVTKEKEVEYTRKTLGAPENIDTRTVHDIKGQLIKKVNADGKLTAKQHLKSLLFGLGLAGVVGLIISFALFNEVFIAPFISPGKSVSTTPIVGNSSGTVDKNPKIIIPKINLEVPVIFDMTTIDEAAIQKSLENGVVHYASTPSPGENGNIVIVGHSSNNILNSGKYKFAFVLLKRLENQDTFFVQKNGIRYTYKVYKKHITSPDDTSVLDTQDKANTITLITCDPPGTSRNRLVVVAEQIYPSTKKNTASTAPKIDTQKVKELPSNAPSLWSRIWPF